MNYIKINNKDRPVRFGWNALAEYERLTGMSLLQLVDMKNMGADKTLKLVYIGLLFGAKKEGDPVDFTVEDVGDWLDDNENIIPDTINIFIKSMPSAGKKK